MQTITTYKISINGDYSFYSIEEAKDWCKSKIASYGERFKSLADQYIDPEIIVEERGYMNRKGYTDVEPYEIVRVVSPKCVEIRAMDTEFLNKDEMKFHAGGFSAHCSNNYSQKYSYKSNEQNPIKRIRLRKNGWGNGHTKYNHSMKPCKFYDFNF